MIKVSSLKAGYGGPPVLKDISLDIRDGEFVGILGPNACGKSTLVKTLSGVLKATGGTVEVFGLDPANCEPRELAKKIAVVPQSTEITFPFTGDEIVRMGRYCHVGRFSPLTQPDFDAVNSAMVETDTVDLAERAVTEVSGGERQRLILARAFAQQSPLLLLDEATASMDIHRKIETFDLLQRKNAKGSTIIAVMHDLNLAALYCRRLILMRDGCIHADGPTEEIFTPEVLQSVYDTPMEVFTHQATGRPHAVFLPGSDNAKS